MSIYLRKSIRVGPLRFNLSKSGIGVSAGIPGFRVGMGPRGNYVHMGRGGLYYRTTLKYGDKNRLQSRPFDKIPSGQMQHATHAPLEEIESADVLQITDSSSADLLDEMKQKRARIRWMPITLISLIMLLLSGMAQGWSARVNLAIVVAGLVACIYVHVRDTLRKSVVLFYEFDESMETAYSHLHASATELSRSAAIWHVAASGEVYDRKYHAGASNLVKRNKTWIRRMAPPFLKTNIETVAVNVGRQTLYFFPDRVFVYEAAGIGAVGYRDLKLEVSPTRFIEEGSVPRDAEVVDYTWRFVNKSGGPDRRFKNNIRLPVCRYEDIYIRSASGLNELIEISRCGCGEHFHRAIRELARVMPKEA
ncbi:DUF4236 domain-containing protein [Oleiagrimonas sp. MCCC 1A03011]|uniref:DUF4236 domain-containing protein n=1 Tax=Oleiagrimonas sp. MCCC 1A03011 TaxID=1926883 RepID=UPI000DC3AD3B|nr:DUF4236 domain-containing protein [Oleiagrimonas sp. MCCC 1A03011]RAP58192.1 hypothetical protein BTJ49_04215 [Oleiagrimonas sp. MCCC 1A03011]